MNKNNILYLKNFYKRYKAFTLVEIMMVVAILGLLLAIGIPGFLKARNKSWLSTEMSNLKAIEDASAMYSVNVKTVNWSSWNGDPANSGPYINISYLWPSSSTIADTASYIRKQLVCPHSKCAYGYIASSPGLPQYNNKAACYNHGADFNIINEWAQ